MWLCSHTRHAGISHALHVDLRLFRNVLVFVICLTVCDHIISSIRYLSRIRVVSNDRIKIAKNLLFWQDILSIKLPKPYIVKHREILHMWQYLANARIITPSDFSSNPLQQQQQVADALYGVNAAAERIPGAAHVPPRSAVLPARPKSPGKSRDGWESWDGCCL